MSDTPQPTASDADPTDHEKARPPSLTMAEIRALKTRRVERVPIVVGDTVVEFILGGLTRLRFEQLVEEHPPTDEHRRAGSFLWNPDTFPPALIAASSIDPVMTVEDVEALWADADGAWSAGESASLAAAAMRLSLNGTAVHDTLRVGG